MATNNTPPKSPFKWVVLTVGTLVGVAHIGVLGHVLNATKIPVINFPQGDYSSYKLKQLGTDTELNIEQMTLEFYNQKNHFN